MTAPSVIIGIDISQDSFSWTPYFVQEKAYGSPQTLPNQPEGFDALRQWVAAQERTPSQVLLCLEHTGVYADRLCYWLKAQGFALAVEPPHKVKRAFQDTFQKTDPLDSRQIAEYAVRFLDQLHLWTPPLDTLEHLQALLSTREQFTRQLTMSKNSLHALVLKHVRTLPAEQSLQSVIQQLKAQIALLDKEINKSIDHHPTLQSLHLLLTSIPGVGTLLAANLLLMTDGFTKTPNPKQLAAFFGIAPFVRQSGSSLYRPPRSRGFGPQRVRKLLYLAALSLRTHNHNFRHYFLRKVQEGKNKKLVLNNIANRLLRIICAVIKSNTPFIDNYKSVNPLALSLTRS